MKTEKVAKKSADILMNAYKKIVPVAGVTLPGRCARGPSGQSYHVNDECIESINRAGKIIIPRIDHYPQEKCIDLLIDMVVAEKDANTPVNKVHDRLRLNVHDFIKRFDAQGEWEVLFAVKGIVNDDLPFTVGPCSFYLMDENSFKLWGQRCASGRYKVAGDMVIHQNWKQENSHILNKIVSVIRVTSINPDHARTKGRIRLEEVLNVLRYCQLVIGVSESRFPEIGISLPEGWDEYQLAFRLDKPSSSTNRMNCLASLRIWHAKQLDGYKELENLVNINFAKRNELQRRVSNALQWLGQAALAPSRSIRIVALFTALEAVFIEESESIGKKSKLSKRISKLIASNDSEITILIRRIEDLYKTRSESVHAGVLDIEKKEITDTVQLISKTFEAVLGKEPYASCESLNDLLKFIDSDNQFPKISNNDWVAENTYLRWLNAGCPHNQQFQHWMDAEREFILTKIIRNRNSGFYEEEQKMEDESAKID